MKIPNSILLEYSKIGEARISELMHNSGIKSKKELLNASLSVFDWVLKEIHAGRVITSNNIKGHDRKILNLPFRLT